MEISTVLIIIILGIIWGIVTGLTPGVHINLISIIVLVNFITFLQYFDINELIIFIIVMGIVHSFIDFIPSIIFGVPNADTSLSVLPGHMMVLAGRAYEAIFLSCIGSFFGMLFAFLIGPLFFFGLENTYDFIKEYIPYLLLFTLISLIFFEPTMNNKFWASIIVLFSGSLGMLTLSTTLIDNSLMVLFTGLLGTSTIIHSIMEKQAKIPPQELDVNFRFSKDFFKAVSIGGICSTICSVSPGIGNAQAGTLSALFFKKISSEIFIVVLSAINTINFILSFLTFYLIERARNGAVFVISQIADEILFDDLKIYFAIIFFISIAGFFLTLYLGKGIIKIVSRLNFEMINYSILILLIVLVFVMSNIYGLLILLCSTFLGLLCINLGIRRVHLMGVLLVPVILNLI